jgi:hypothetical protein
MNHTATREGWEDYQNDVDYFAYYFPRYNYCCLVPIEYVGTRKTITMNFSEEKPTSAANWYKDFSFEEIIK